MVVIVPKTTTPKTAALYTKQNRQSQGEEERYIPIPERVIINERMQG